MGANTIHLFKESDYFFHCSQNSISSDTSTWILSPLLSVFASNFSFCLKAYTLTSSSSHNGFRTRIRTNYYLIPWSYYPRVLTTVGRAQISHWFRQFPISLADSFQTLEWILLNPGILSLLKCFYFLISCCRDHNFLQFFFLAFGKCTSVLGLCPVSSFVNNEAEN